MATKGQTISDRFNSAKYTIVGQAIARCICKATTEELIKPKKKHLDYLVACTHEPNVSMQQMANLLIERTNHTNWVVVYKSLITLHYLMSNGNERFTQYLASSNYDFSKNCFNDRAANKGYVMSPYIRRYSNFINEKALAYRSLAIDLCKLPRKENDVINTMPVSGLLTTVPVIHKLLRSLLDFDCRRMDLTNEIINASLVLMFRDAIRLFASLNGAVARLFEKYLELDKKASRQVFDYYKEFLVLTDRLSEFLKLSEAINIDQSHLPQFRKAPESLVDAFEKHVLTLESNNNSKNDKTFTSVDQQQSQIQDQKYIQTISSLPTDKMSKKKSVDFFTSFEPHEEARFAYSDETKAETSKLTGNVNDLIVLDE